MRVPGVSAPRQVLRGALAELEAEGLALDAVSSILDSRPLGPSARRYANAAAVVTTDLNPSELLVLLQRIEQAFGRRRRGQAWRSRPLDLDIILWSGGVWLSRKLTIPHPAFRGRTFVLGPAATIASRWTDPETGLTLRHLRARLTAPRPLLR